jgi:hypothetical protein
MAADTATAMRELMTGMREATVEASRVAAVVAAAQVSAAHLSHERLTKMIGDSRADTLAAVEVERYDTRDAIAALRDRMDLSDRDASSAWTDLSERIRHVQTVAQPEPVEPESVLDMPPVQKNSTTSALAFEGAAQVRDDWANNNWGSTDRNHRPITSAGRARSERTDQERETEMKTAHALEMAAVTRPRATDTRAGVSIHLGRDENSILFEPCPPRRTTDTSTIGRGSRKFHT